MKIHIGEIIHKTVKNLGLGPKDLARGINVSESTVYDIYKRESLDVERLIEISLFLKINLLEPYLRQKPLKDLVNDEVVLLKREIEELKAAVKRKDQIVDELEKLNKVLQQRLELNK